MDKKKLQSYFACYFLHELRELDRMQEEDEKLDTYSSSEEEIDDIPVCEFSEEEIEEFLHDMVRTDYPLTYQFLTERVDNKERDHLMRLCLFLYYVIAKVEVLSFPEFYSSDYVDMIEQMGTISQFVDQIVLDQEDAMFFDAIVSEVDIAYYSYLGPEVENRYFKALDQLFYDEELRPKLEKVMTKCLTTNEKEQELSYLKQWHEKQKIKQQVWNGVTPCFDALYLADGLLELSGFHTTTRLDFFCDKMIDFSYQDEQATDVLIRKLLVFYYSVCKDFDVNEVDEMIPIDNELLLWCEQQDVSHLPAKILTDDAKEHFTRLLEVFLTYYRGNDMNAATDKTKPYIKQFQQKITGQK